MTPSKTSETTNKNNRHAPVGEKSLRIVLASASPRRQQLLSQIGLDFEVITPHGDETQKPGDRPGIHVERLAIEKATDVATGCTQALVIGADTIVVLDRVILGKPETPEHAVEMLLQLSGRTHQVFTGVSLIRTGEEGLFLQKNSFHEITEVTFGRLRKSDIEAYVASGSPLDKAGSYGIQDDLGALFVQRINGDYYNVVGFPLFRFYTEVNKMIPGHVTPFK